MKPEQEIIVVEPQREVMNLDTCLAAWLDEAKGRSKSVKTETAYQTTLTEFRAMLHIYGRDLDTDAAILAPMAQGWAAMSKTGREVTPNTFNQRLAILSSFYRYAMRHEVLTSNPIERVKRRVVTKEHKAHAVKPARIKKGLGEIDRSTPEGKRDYALIAVALETGHRVSELAAMRYGHLQKNGETTTVYFPRCKGNKAMSATLPPKTTRALYDYLHSVYGARLGTLEGDAPVWVSFSPQNRGQAIGVRTLERICERVLGTSKMHATRHSWAKTMMDNGATIQEIGRGLGHSNLKTTSEYLEELSEYENPHASKLEDAFGIDG